MEARIAVLLVIAMLTLGCVGQESNQEIGPASDNGDADAASQSGNGSLLPDHAENASANLTRDQLEDQRVHLTQEGAGWRATRLVVTPDLWDGDWDEEGGSVDISLALEHRLQTANESLLGLGFMLPSSFEDGGEPWTSLTFFAMNEQAPPLGASFYTSCSGEGCKDDPPRLEYVFIHGTRDGSANLSIGIPGEGEDPLAAGIADREAIDWPTEHDGQHMDGGTHLSLQAAGTPISQPLHMEWTAGAVTVDDEAPTPRPAGVQAAAHHRIGAEAGLPADGTTMGLFAALDSVEASIWDVEWAMPSTSGAETGIWARAGPLSAGFGPGWAAYQEHGPGNLSLALERTTSGKQGPGIAADQGIPLAPRIVVGTWGFFDATLEEMYGWKLDQFATSSSPLSSPADSPEAVEATAKLCPASFDGPCLLEDPRGAYRGSR